MRSFGSAALALGRGSRGQSLVEFALILPVLLALVMGVFDLGRGVLYYNLLAEATREGARFAVVHGSLSGSPAGPSPDNEAVAEVVRDHALNLAADGLIIHSTWPDGNNNRGSRVRVEASFEFRPVSLIPLGDATIPLRASTEMAIAH